jgi:hypothetical protein
VEPRGVVYISPVIIVPPGLRLDPEASLFGASWQDDYRELDSLDYVTAASAIAWGRDRAQTVLIRLGGSIDDYFTAGDRRPHDDSPEEPDIPDWPPTRPPKGGWWQLPPFPSLAEVEETSARVRGGELTEDDGRLWAEERFAALPELDHEPDVQILRALAELRGYDG